MVAKISNDPAIVSYHPGLQAEMLCSFYHFRMVLDYLFLLFQKRIHASSTIEKDRSQRDKREIYKLSVRCGRLQPKRLLPA